MNRTDDSKAFSSPVDADVRTAKPFFALALWVMSTELEILRQFSQEDLLNAEKSLVAAEDWLQAWQQVLHAARKRTRQELSDNIVVLDPHRCDNRKRMTRA